MAICSECGVGLGHLLGCSAAVPAIEWRVSTTVVVEDVSAELAADVVRQRVSRVEGITELCVCGVAPV